MNTIEQSPKRVPVNLTNEEAVIMPNNPGDRSTIATFFVPRERVYEVVNKFFQLKLPAGEVFPAVTGVTSHIIQLTHPIARDPTISLKGANVILVQEVGGINTEVPVANYEVDEITRNITITGLVTGTTYVFKAYYLFGCNNSSVKINVLSPDGNTGRNILPIGSIRSINISNQEDINKGLRLSMAGLPIPQNFRIELEVTTPASIILYGKNEAPGQSPFSKEGFINIPMDSSARADWPVDLESQTKVHLATV